MNDASDTGPLAGWVIVQAQGMTLIGRSWSAHKVLRPVFELKPVMSDRGIGHMVVPVWLLGVDELETPAGAIVHPCEELTRSQRVHLLKSVQQAEELSATMRAQDAGITLATTLPKGR